MLVPKVSDTCTHRLGLMPVKADISFQRNVIGDGVLIKQEACTIENRVMQSGIKLNHMDTGIVHYYYH